MPGSLESQRACEHSSPLLTGKIAARRTVRGTAFMGVTSVARFLISLLGTVVIIRSLPPADFGPFEISGTVTTLLTSACSLGLSEASVQKAYINDRQLSGLFFLNVCLGAAMFLAISILSPVLALVYKDPRLCPLTIMSGLMLLIVSAGLQHDAILIRNQRYIGRALVDVASIATGVAVALWAARQGYGVWALVWQSLAAAAVSTCGLTALSRWRPKLATFRGLDLKPLIRFGGSITAARLLFAFLSRVDRLILGYFVSPAILGQYGRAANIATLQQGFFVGIFETPIRSYLSRIQLVQDYSLTRQYARYFRLVLAGPVFAVLLFAISSREIVIAVLGPRWELAASVMPYLSCAVALRLIQSSLFSLFLSMGQSRSLVMWTVISGALTFAVYLLAGPLGPTATSVATIVSASFFVVVGFVILRWRMPEITVLFSADTLIVSGCVLVAILNGGMAKILFGEYNVSPGQLIFAYNAIAVATLLLSMLAVSRRTLWDATAGLRLLLPAR